MLSNELKIVSIPPLDANFFQSEKPRKTQDFILLMTPSFHDK